MATHKVRVGITGFGTIGERIADGVNEQADMEIVGVCDAAPAIPVRALIDSGQRYPLYAANAEGKEKLENAGADVAGMHEDLIEKVDIMVDAASPGIPAQNKSKYESAGIKAIFEGGESNEIADVLFNTHANYSEALGKNFIKNLSCNTTGICRTILTLDNAFGVKEFTSLIVRRAADPSETHKGPINAAMPAKVPSHQAEDFMIVKPEISAVTVVVTVPITHGHINSTQAVIKESANRDDILDAFSKEPRIKLFKLGDGFDSNSTIFDYNRDLLNPRGDMYEVPIWEETVYVKENVVYWVQMIPQEAIVIPENIDAIRAAMQTHESAEEAMRETNRYLSML